MKRLLDELDGVVNALADPAGGDVQFPGHFFARKLFIIIEIENVTEPGLEPLDGPGDVLGPLPRLGLIMGIGRASGSGASCRTLAFMRKWSTMRRLVMM